MKQVVEAVVVVASWVDLCVMTETMELHQKVVQMNAVIYAKVERDDM